MRQAKKNRGLTVSEMVVGMFVFGMLMVVAAMSLRRTTTIWERTSSSSTSQLEMRKAHSALLLDLERTEREALSRADGPVTLAGRDGDAIWFLSPIDPSGASARTSQGRPFWRRNILYYTVVPNNHNLLYGQACAGGADGQGYESRCPHKVLIRKVIDNPPATDGSDETAPETLLSNVTPYLTRPQGFDTSNMDAEAGLESAEIKAQSLLGMRVRLGSTPTWPNEVLVELRSARIEEARRTVQLGTDSLDPWTQQLTFSVFPPPAVE